MKTEREKITGKVAAAALRLAGEPYTLEPGEENCYLLLVYEGSIQLEYGGETMLVNPGSAVLLGPGGGRLLPQGSAAAELVGCHFPLEVLHELRSAAGRDYTRRFASGQSGSAACAPCWK